MCNVSCGEVSPTCPCTRLRAYPLDTGCHYIKRSTWHANQRRTLCIAHAASHTRPCCTHVIASFTSIIITLRPCPSGGAVQRILSHLLQWHATLAN